MKPRASYRPLVESLESRELMAGDVAVALEGSLLKVTGDNLDNQVVITQAANGNITVAGIQGSGTTVNGGASVTLIRPALNQLDIRMEGGSDLVRLRGVAVTNDLNVDLGAGNDQLIAPAAWPVQVGANAEFLGESGDDRFQVANLSVGSDLKIDGGTGAMTANLSGLLVDQAMTVIGDDLPDVVTIRESQIGDSLSVETKKGGDRVTLEGIDALNLAVTSDLGPDRVRLTSVNVQEDISVETGDGADRVDLISVASGKNITVKTDAGNDTVVATDAVAALDAVFGGGAGFDVLDDNGIVGGTKREIIEFERFI